ncbi:hypothetical protein BDN72DRAFT_964444 [Pluteus cervinus]|uniref:Uncharacterized protein n=1 Tax=Pluteus cervinus TaxID=181527 RepID=A0ACD3AA37_9AGAR|nr:hypothetical protein BDN72DRAFT_964444 [Pluteus cervinus]
MKHEKSPDFGHLHLPAEVIDNILAEVDLHSDLIQLACCSRLFNHLVIPRHTEYRVIQLGVDEKYQHLFAHLSRRPDLASLVREIHLVPVAFEEDAARLHLPKSYIKDGKEATRILEEKNFDIIGALRFMTRLQGVRWVWSSIGQGETRAHLQSRVMVRPILETLRDVGFLQPRSYYKSHPFLAGQPVDDYGLWKVASLSLIGDMWSYKPKPDPAIDEIFLCCWLQNLSNLEFLILEGHILLEHIQTLSFVNLRSLGLFTQLLDPADIKQITTFLQRHPTITALTWGSIGKLQVPYYFLPNLTQLVCKPELLAALVKTYVKNEARNPPPRPIECLVLLPRTAPEGTKILRGVLASICDKSFIDRRSLRRLSVHRIDFTSDLGKIARAFPMIRELKIPQDENITCADLKPFRNLEVLHDRAMWYEYKGHIAQSRRLQRKPEQLLEATIIQDLAEYCPKLRQVDHPTDDDLKIIITRGSEGQVSYRSVDRSPKAAFDLIPRTTADRL